MRDYVIVTDSDTEIAYRYAEEKKLPVFSMPYTINDKEYFYDLGKNVELEKEFFKLMRAGAKVATSTRPPMDIKEFFTEQLKKGVDILYLCFSSELSGHYNLATLAAEEAMQEFLKQTIHIIDLKSISLPAGMIVMKAVEKKEQGMSMDQLTKWVEENKHRGVAWFVVDDLIYLKNGGRLSGTAAFMGTLLDIKPILTVTQEGKIVNVDKMKGLALAKKYLVERIEENIDPDNSMVYILHADCEDQANDLKDKILAKNAAKEVQLKMVGPVIGCHCGPGTLAVVFWKKA